MIWVLVLKAISTSLPMARKRKTFSLILYNIIKLIFIKIKMNYWPFSINTLKLLIMGTILYVIIGFIPDIFMNFLDLFLKGIIILVLYYLSVKVIRLDADVIRKGEEIVLEYYNKLKLRK